ncbi:MAG: type II toxin-antitoxin system RelE/ParE family toxin [Acetobacteraceae bacterium]|nr:type II toxin-antitoxin system RelE/ParE family toxin [Acetobacteraceae bacterium]
MRRPVVWAASARADHLGIVRHIARENLDATERVAARTEDAAAALADFATGRAGRVSGTYEKVLPGLPYILAREIVPRPEGGEAVAILHVIHGARDWPAEEWPKA